MPVPMCLDLRLKIVGGRARQLDPPGGAAFCGQPVGLDQADPAGTGDRKPPRRRAVAAIAGAGAAGSASWTLRASVFLDETGTATNMARRYGRGRSEQRLVAAVPHGHRRTATFIAGLRQTGIIAPLVFDGPMTGPAFRAYIEQVRTPALAPGDDVVLDNPGGRIRSTGSARRSPPPAPRSSTCRPAART